MKGVTPLIAVVLVLLVMLTMTGLGFLFISTATESATDIITKQQALESGGAPRIDHIANYTVYVYSAGRTELKNPAFYINGQQVQASGPTSLTPGLIGQYVLDQQEIDNFPEIAELKVSAGNSVDILVTAIRTILPRIIGMGSTFLMGEIVYAQAGLILFRDSSNTTDLVAITDAGRVGIGTTTPGEKLDVTGRIKGTELCIGTDCRSTWPSGSSSQWTTSGSNIYYNTGNVGIRTATPTGTLDVNGTAFIGPQDTSSEGGEIRLRKSGGAYEDWSIDVWQNRFRVFSAGTEKFTIVNSTGNVGIGTTTPSRQLDTTGNVKLNNAAIGDVGYSAMWAGFAHNSVFATGTYALLQRNDGQYTLINKASGAGYIGFRVNNTDQMVILDGGNVGIGTTTPTERLDLAGGNIKMGYQIVTQDCAGVSFCKATCPAGKQAVGGGCVSASYATAFGGNTIGCTDGEWGGVCNNAWFCKTLGYAATTIRTTVICANIK